MLPFIGTTSFFSALFILICYIIEYKAGMLIMSTNFILFLSIILLFKKQIINYFQASNLYIFNCSATVALLSIFYSGGIFSPFLITYIMIAVITVLLLGKSKISWTWLTSFLLIIIAISFTHYLGYNLPIEYNRNYDNFFFTMSLIGVPLCTFFISLIFERQNEASFKLLKENQALTISNEEKDILIKEIHHRVKNNLQIISSLINLQTHELNDEKTIEVLNITKSRIYALSLIHKKLYTGDNIGNVNFTEHIKEVIDSQKHIFYNVESSVSGDNLEISLDVATPLSLIINELITNAFKHAFKDIATPKIEITIHNIDSEMHEIVVKDNGVGLPQNFNFDNPKSLGMLIINSLSEQISASVNYNSSEEGTEFKIRFNTKA